jgi:Concanavalin A-like lectin/glucanases superfamily
MTLLTSLAAYWKLDDLTGADSTANSNTITFTGSPSSVAGRIINGVSFNGTSQYGTAPSSASLLASSAWSISAWVYIPSPTTMGTYSCILQFGSGLYVYYILQIQYYSGTHRLMYGNRNSIIADNLGYALSASTWYHCAATYDGTTARGYLNGSSTGSHAISPYSGGTPALSMGSYGTANLFPGTIDEVGVWSRMLTSTEVTTLYASGAGYPYSSFGGGGGSSNLFVKLVGPGGLITPGGLVRRGGLVG